jgi:DNA-binding CsgD family transcriptional regulator
MVPVGWRKYVFRRIVARKRGAPLLRLRQHDLRALLEFLRQTYAVQSLDSFRIHLLSGLKQLVPSEITAYNEVNLRTQHNEVVYDRPGEMSIPGGEEIFDRYIPEHPLIEFSKRRRGHGPVKISDFLSASQFHRLGLYSEFFRLIGVEDQMVMSLPSARPVVIGIALNRGRRNFSERDRLLLNLVYPHLLQAYRNAEAWTRTMGHLKLMQQALEGSSAAIIILSNTGRVETITPKANSLLAKYLDGRAVRHNVLPEVLQRWVEEQQMRLNDPSEVPPTCEALAIQHHGGCLSVRQFRDSNQILLFLEESTPAPERIDGFGLTKREGEVLAWVSRGKTNRDISGILGMSPRTVQKHVEHIFQKLGVETRTAAATKALEHRAREVR